jgi:hypothetical protein
LQKGAYPSFSLFLSYISFMRDSNSSLSQAI